MLVPPIPDNEPKRLKALEAYEIMDTDPESGFDDITWLAQEIAQVPISLISLVDATRQWFKSKQGLDAPETPREISFCGHTINGNEPFVVPDTLRDERFADNPLVSGAPDIRFYLGIPLTTPNNLNIGTLCVIDRVPRELTKKQVSMLAALGRQVISTLELRIAGKRITQYAQAAEKANKAKSQFLANMSHEIRTPMNAIIGMTDITLLTQLNPDQRECLETVRNSSHSLLHLLNDILDFSKIEAGKLKIETIEFLLHEQMEGLIRTYGPRAADRGLFLNLDIQPNIPATLIGDPYRLQQALINLIGNGIKFTESGGVTLSVQAMEMTDQQLWLQFKVMDTGIGISNGQLKDIFNSFTQADDSITRVYGGTGLGLAITANLAKLMGGQLRVESQIDKGSSFFLELPFPKAACAELTGAVNERSFMANDSVHAYKILLVEDNIINQKVAIRILSKLNHEVTVASSGNVAVDLFRKNQFDVVLMDIGLPDIDGYQTTALIREHEKKTGRHTPIIAVTAQALLGDREQSLNAGMDEYLAKPICLDALNSKITQVMKDK